MKLTGDKINLRFPTFDDVESIARYANDSAISEYTYIPYPYDKSDAVEFLNLTAEVHKEKTGLHFALEDKQSGNVVGMIGFNTINYMHLHAEVGYWVARDFWGKGYSVEAVNLLVAYAFSKTELERIYAYVRPENIASWKLLEKTGFEREGLLKKLMRKDDKRYDHYIYAIVKS